MQIIPVIDIRHGMAVRAVAGNRGQYQRLNSRLTLSAEPIEVLRALHREFHCDACYVADLDAIEGRPANRCLLAEMARTGVRLVVDAGVTSIDHALDLTGIGIHKVILSSESLPEICRLPDFVKACTAESLTFSLDLKLGQLLAADPEWVEQSPLDLAADVVQHGIRELVVLDLAAVGTGTGIPTLTLCREIKQRWPDLNVISGGGVHSVECLRTARQAGLDGLLIASALHDGRLTESDLKSFEGTPRNDSN